MDKTKQQGWGLIGKMVKKVEVETEKKSWEPYEEIYFDVGIKRKTKPEIYGYSFEWFWKSFRLQTKDYPRGITKERALILGNRVYRRTVKHERLK